MPRKQKTEQEIPIDGTVRIMPKSEKPMGQISITMPGYLLKIIDREAGIKGKSRSMVIAYLVLTGIKAHAGEFELPANNTLRGLWKDR